MPEQKKAMLNPNMKYLCDPLDNKESVQEIPIDKKSIMEKCTSHPYILGFQSRNVDDGNGTREQSWYCLENGL